VRSRDETEIRRRDSNSVWAPSAPSRIGDDAPGSWYGTRAAGRRLDDREQAGFAEPTASASTATIVKGGLPAQAAQRVADVERSRSNARASRW